MSRRLFIDAETYLFTVAAGCSYEVQFAWDDWHHWTDHDMAKLRFSEAMEKLSDETGIGERILAFGHATNFRYAVMPGYKRNRRLLRKPAGYKQLMAWAITTFNGITLPGCEGDDVVGILAGYDDLIASRDKDLQTIPGHHWLKDGEVEISHHRADLAHLEQTLSGDETDGYSGCPGLGPIKARRLLEGAPDTIAAWALVVGAYEKAGLTAADALRNARVARILRRHEYDLAAQLPRLWEPPVAWAHPTGADGPAVTDP